MCLIRYLNHCRTDAVNTFFSPPPNQLRNCSGTRSDCVASCVQKVTCFPSCIHMTQQYIQKQNRKLSWQCWETDLYTCLLPAHTGCVWCDPAPPPIPTPRPPPQLHTALKRDTKRRVHPYFRLLSATRVGSTELAQWWGTFVSGEGNKWHR